MLNSNGIEFRNEQGIFPIVVFDRQTQNFRCIGTSFFINGFDVFVTAKHVLVDEIDGDNMIFVAQSLSNHQVVNRVITDVCHHPSADITVGLVGIARHPLTAKEIPYELAPSCRLSFKQLQTGTEVLGFGYPKGEKVINANLQTFTLNCTGSQGIVEDFHLERFGRLGNRCYQTNMKMPNGCSGGPVFNNGYVVGITSTGFDEFEDQSPTTFVTPVDYLLDLQLLIEDELMTIKQMIKKDMIVAES